MEFQNNCSPTGRDYNERGENAFHVIYSSNEMAAGREALRNAAVGAMQMEETFDRDMAEEAVTQITEFADWKISRVLDVKRAQLLAKLLRYGGTSILDNEKSELVLSMADQLDNEAECRSFADVTIDDILN